MRVIIYFPDGVQARFDDVHNVTTSDELFSFTYTNVIDCTFHNVSYCRDQIDRISIREVSI